ncbi:hypothetical protein O6H91_14G066100 [Diphasiastrum complanatum]|uniref:Uncharacterized protein n=1 Tax=Diphasiastrum complanatum TaxID=34168 RepID=A0ACC2BRB4_DIPCM|nr:hypothetical protein O6H91_14G066100 [Diphasiastrum complanatum]
MAIDTSPLVENDFSPIFGMPPHAMELTMSAQGYTKDTIFRDHNAESVMLAPVLGDDDLFSCHQQIGFQTIEPTSVLDYAYSPHAQARSTPILNTGSVFTSLENTMKADEQVMNVEDFVVDHFPQPQIMHCIGANVWSMDSGGDALACSLEGDSMKNMIDSSTIRSNCIPGPDLITSNPSGISSGSESRSIQNSYDRGSIDSDEPRLIRGGQKIQFQENIWNARNAKTHLELLNDQKQQTQLQLVQLLLAGAEAVDNENYDLTRMVLARLSSQIVPYGSPMQRLACYLAEALAARITYNNFSGLFKGLAADRLFEHDKLMQNDMAEAFSTYYESLPLGKFAHLTMNEIILDAIAMENVVHIIDFQVWYGAQWPAFLQGLAMRPGGPPCLRMTAIGPSIKDLKENGEKLSDCARNLNVQFEYCPLLVNLQDFHVGMLDVRRGEVCVVNSFGQFHRLLNKGSSQFERVIYGLKSLKPRVLVMAETDADHNSPSFSNRFVECLKYYSGIFDALDTSLSPGSLARLKIEQLFAGQIIRNVVACEGESRLERHESMSSWQKRMESAGFLAGSLSIRAMSQANLLINLYYSQDYSICSDEGSLVLQWQGMPFIGVSAWH